MPRVTQAPPPGFVRAGTPEATPGRYYDGNNVRWRGNVLQPIGGSILLPGSATPTIPRDVITWHDNSYQRWAAFGTDQKLYTYSFDNEMLYDITPAGVGPLQAPGPFAGYGLNTYGTGLYGTTRTSSGIPPGIIGELGDVWSMDTFGETLLVVPTQDGRLFQWLPTTPTVAAAVVANAPTADQGVIVTDQRHVVLLGAGGNPRMIAWSDQENPTVWTPGIANLAGSKLLQTQATSLCAIKVPAGVLIFTTNDVHLMAYVGTPYAYGIVQIGAGCGPISARAVTGIGGFVAWPSWENFWLYNGNVQPLQCDVKDYFFSTINAALGGLVFGSANPQFAELWWDWPDESSLQNSRYIAVNYGAQTMPWLIGQRARTAADRLGVMNYPVLGGSPDGTTGALYQHEYGYLDNGTPRASAGSVYAETSNIVLGEGDRRYNVNQLVFDADTDTTSPAIGYRFFPREQPYDFASETDTGLITAIHGGLMDLHFSGRSTRMRVQATQDVWWGVGRPRLDMTPAGRR